MTIINNNYLEKLNINKIKIYRYFQNQGLAIMSITRLSDTKDTIPQEKEHQTSVLDEKPRYLKNVV